MIDKYPCLEDKNGISHQKEDLSHGIPLVPVMERAIVFVGDDPPEVPDIIALHVDNEDQEEEAEEQEEDLETLRRVFDQSRRYD